MLGSVGGLCGIVHGAGNAMLIRGGACAAELRLMGVCVLSCNIVIDLFKLCSLCVFCFLFRGGDLCLCVILTLSCIYECCWEDVGLFLCFWSLLALYLWCEL